MDPALQEFPGVLSSIDLSGEKWAKLRAMVIRSFLIFVLSFPLHSFGVTKVRKKGNGRDCSRALRVVYDLPGSLDNARGKIVNKVAASPGYWVATGRSGRPLEEFVTEGPKGSQILDFLKNNLSQPITQDVLEYLKYYFQELDGRLEIMSNEHMVIRYKESGRVRRIILTVEKLQIDSAEQIDQLIDQNPAFVGIYFPIIE